VGQGRSVCKHAAKWERVLAKLSGVEYVNGHLGRIGNRARLNAAACARQVPQTFPIGGHCHTSQSAPASAYEQTFQPTLAETPSPHLCYTTVMTPQAGTALISCGPADLRLSALRVADATALAAH
jgi:hypothetical protein